MPGRALPPGLSMWALPYPPEPRAVPGGVGQAGALCRLAVPLCWLQSWEGALWPLDQDSGARDGGLPEAPQPQPLSSPVSRADKVGHLGGHPGCVKAFHGLADSEERIKGAALQGEGDGWRVVPAGHCPRVPTSLRIQSRPRTSGLSGERVVAGVPWAGELQSLLLREPDGGCWMGPESTPGFMGASVRGPGEVPSLGWAPWVLAGWEETGPSSCSVFIWFLATLRGARDLSSPTRDRTHTPCVGSAVLTTGPRGKSSSGCS